MAFLSQSFDISDLPKPSNDFSPLPAGWYSATISGAEIKQTKAGTGEYIAVKYSVMQLPQRPHGHHSQLHARKAK